MSAANYGLYDRNRPRHPALLVEDELTIGSLTFDYGDVEAFERSASSERDWDGQLMCAAFYGMSSALFLIGILIGSLDLKFVIAVVFLAAICFMSICDALAMPTVVVHRLTLTLRDGRRLTFADGDERVAAILARRLRLAGADER